MNRVGRNEDRISRAENALCPSNPLLDLARDDQDHLFLVRMLVKVMSHASIQFAIKDAQWTAAIDPLCGSFPDV